MGAKDIMENKAFEEDNQPDLEIETIVCPEGVIKDDIFHITSSVSVLNGSASLRERCIELDNIHPEGAIPECYSINQKVEEDGNDTTFVTGIDLDNQWVSPGSHDCQEKVNRGHLNEAFVLSVANTVSGTAKKEMEDDQAQKRFLTSPETKSDKGYHDDDDDDDVNLEPGKCGLGSCHPSTLQRCKTMGCFSAVYCGAGIMTSALSVYINSQITALEKQFNISSSISGLLMSSNDFGFILTALICSYAARKVHMPRVLALSTFLYGVSGLFCTVAYFGTRDQLPSPPSVVNTDERLDAPSQMCALGAPFWNGSGSDSKNDSMTSSCGNGHSEANIISDDWRTAAIVIIAVGMMIQGAAKAPRSAFIGTYVDDNVPKTRTPLYLGIIFGITVCGPAAAFAVGSVFSKIHVTLEETNMSRRDPRWIGAWWLGFLVFGAGSLVAGIPIIFFPKHMHRKSVENKIKRQKMAMSQNNANSKIKDFFKIGLRLITNPVYVVLNLSQGFNLLSIGGITTFMAKYLEVHYIIPAYQANMFLGVIVISSASLGGLVGGFVTSRLKLGPVACLRLMIFLGTLSTLAIFTSFAANCQQPVIFRNDGLDDNISSQPSRCVSDCQCKDGNFFPVCGADGVTYYSPCHAGCGNYVGVQGFANCTCLSNNETTMATPGLCDPGCGDKLMIYVIMTFFFGFVGSFGALPAFVINVRSVRDTDKPMALGTSSFVSTLLGWFPAPVIYGAIVDSTCEIWNDSSCGEKGACLLYDTTKLNYYYHGLIIGLRSLFMLGLVLIYLYVTCTKRFTFQPHDDGKDDEDVAMQMREGNKK